MSRGEKVPTVGTLADLVEARCAHNLRPMPFATCGGGEVIAEPPRPSGTFILDDLLSGLIPGSVTVLRTRWDEAALAVAAEITLAVARTRRVLVTVPPVSAPPFLDVVTARAARITIDRARLLDGIRDPEGYATARRALDGLPVTVALDVSSPEAARAVARTGTPAVIVALHADAGGSVDVTVLPEWRALARDLGIAVITHVSGTAKDWTHPADAHIELVHTHIGRHVAWLSARGVAPGGATERRIDIQLLRTRGALVRRDEDSARQPPPRCTERSWRDDPIDLPLDRTALERIVTNPEWNPDSNEERHAVLTSLAMLAFDEGLPTSRTPWGRDEHALARVLEACGGTDAWAQVLLEIGAGRDRAAWSRVERAGLPRVKVPDGAPQRGGQRTIGERASNAGGVSSRGLGAPARS